MQFNVGISLALVKDIRVVENIDLILSRNEVSVTLALLRGHVQEKWIPTQNDEANQQLIDNNIPSNFYKISKFRTKFKIELILKMS